MLFAAVSRGFGNKKMPLHSYDSFVLLETVFTPKVIYLDHIGNFDRTHLLLRYSKCLNVTLKHNHSSAN